MRQKKGEVNSNNGVCRRDILNIENKLKYATGDKFFFYFLHGNSHGFTSAIQREL